MRPVKTARSNFTWLGPTLEVGDLHARLDPRTGRSESVWEPDADEREAIARGANVKLTVYGVYPPVSLGATAEQAVEEDSRHDEGAPAEQPPGVRPAADGPV